MAAHTTFITNWLESPHRLSEKDQKEFDALLLRYPYFVPAQWIQLSSVVANAGLSIDALHRAKLHLGNWLLFMDAINKSKGEWVEGRVEEPLDQEESLILDDNLEELITTPSEHNYFQQQGIEVPSELPLQTELQADAEDKQKSLMVMMGFDEWLLYLKKKNEAKKSEEEDKAMLRSMWQREKLAAAIGEEDDNIPEAVFERAINSIDKEEIMVSESLAEIHIKQGKYEKAIEIYRKLSLQNPEKKSYFAAKINQLNKEN
jgi:tetratricopeptide (TPR) repeat protein